MMSLLCKVILVFITFWTIVRAQELQRALTRKKRFLTFPKGTVIQLVYCYLMSAIGTEGIFTVGVTLGTNWDVPVDLDKLMFNEHQKIIANRRDRRSLYPKIEYALDQLGIRGKSCVKRLLCNFREEFSRPNNKNTLPFIEELIRTIFIYPPHPNRNFEPIDEYDHMLGGCADFNLSDGCS